MHLSKGSATESCVISHRRRGPPSSSNRCARGHPEPWWHLPLPETERWKLLSHRFLFSFPFFLFCSQSNLFRGTLGLFWLDLQTTGLTTGFSSGSGLYFFVPLCVNLWRVVFSFSSFRIDHKTVVNFSCSVMAAVKYDKKIIKSFLVYAKLQKLHLFSLFFFFFKGKILTSCTVLGKFSQLGNITEQMD